MGTDVRERAFKTLKKQNNRQLRFYLELCTRCGACSSGCHVSRAGGGSGLTPYYRADLLRRFSRRGFSISRLFRPLKEPSETIDQALEKMYQAAYTCTGCRRCMTCCPLGIDTTWITGVEKAVLAAVGMVPHELELLTETSIEKVNSLEIYRDLMREQIRNLEPRLRQLTGMPDAAIPMGVEGARMLYVALEGADNIIGPAVIFNLAGEDWTLSEFEASNYGYFLGDTGRAVKVAERIVREAVKLGVKEVVIAECGHAYRVMKHLYPAWSRQELPFQVKSVLEPWAAYIRDGRLKIKERINEPVTYHDPCQLGRNGGIYQEPREIIRAVVGDFRELQPNRDNNWCCGGGGGIIARGDLEQYQLDTGRMKVEQIIASGARIVVTPCGNCRLQLSRLNQGYNLGVEVLSVAELLGRALLLENGPKTAAGDGFELTA